MDFETEIRFLDGNEDEFGIALDDMLVVDMAAFFGNDISQKIKSLQSIVCMKNEACRIGTDVKTDWNNLPADRAIQYKIYGLTENDWKVVNQSSPVTRTNWKDPTKKQYQVDFKSLRNLDEDIFRRLHEMVISESRKKIRCGGRTDMQESAR